jgi:hypothetical protein
MRLAKCLSLLLHTSIVYICAIRLSPMLTYYWLALFGVSTLSAGDWYLQHLEIVTLLPAAVVGFVITRWRPVGSFWSWLLPTGVLVCGLLLYSSPHSVLVSNRGNKLEYFFHIQRYMPTGANPLVSDPRRVLEQMLITAPFYAGISYSVGAYLAKKTGFLRKDTLEHTVN